MTYLVELISLGFVDLGICKPETKRFGRHLFRDLVRVKQSKRQS